MNDSTRLLNKPGVLDGDFIDITDMQDDVDAQIQSIVAEFGDEEINATYLRIYKTIPNMGKMEWLFNCTVNELPIMERLRDEFGGGKYEARLYGGKPVNMIKKFEILIGAPKSTITKNSNNQELVTVMLDGLNKLGELIVTQKTQVSQPGLASLLGSGNLTEMMQVVTMAKQIFGNNNPVPNPLDMVEKLVSLQGLIGDGKSSEGATNSDVLVELIREFGPPIVKMSHDAQNFTGDYKFDPMTGKPLARKLPSSEKKPQPSESKLKSTQPQDSNPMKMHLMFLTSMAKKNVDPAPYAQMVIDHTSDADLPGLKDFITAPDAIENMVKIHKEVGNFTEWFKELGECLSEIFNEMAVDQQETTLTEPGIIANTSETDTPGASKINAVPEANKSDLDGNSVR